MTDRLTKPDWIAEGLRTLAAEGPSGLKVGAMATRLKVSRGSFYWHFSDITDFRAQVLQGWRDQTTEQVIEDLGDRAGPDRLKHLMRRAFIDRRGLDRAIRSWAAADRDVAAVVAAVDDRRIGYIADLLAAAGVEAKTAGKRATFLYWAYLGQAMMVGGASITGAEMDDISALFER